MKECLLPDCCERNAEIDMLVLHCSAYPADKAISTYREAKVSAHYLIDETGEIIKLVDETMAAYHAGPGFWRGRSDSCNMRSVGVELNWLICRSGRHPTARRRLQPLFRCVRH